MALGAINRNGNFVRGWVAVDLGGGTKYAANPLRIRIIWADLSKQIRANAQSTI
jgi:hypothetical protein